MGQKWTVQTLFMSCNLKNSLHSHDRPILICIVNKWRCQGGGANHLILYTFSFKNNHPIFCFFKPWKLSLMFMVIFGICMAKMNSANSVYELQSYKYSAVWQHNHFYIIVHEQVNMLWTPHQMFQCLLHEILLKLIF